MAVGQKMTALEPAMTCRRKVSSSQNLWLRSLPWWENPEKEEKKAGTQATPSRTKTTGLTQQGQDARAKTAGPRRQGQDGRAKTGYCN